MKWKTMIWMVGVCTSVHLSVTAGEGHAGYDHADPDAQEAQEAQEAHGHSDHAGYDHVEDEHAGHDHAAVPAGPNGGRVITSVEPHLEFLVTDPQRHVELRVLNADGKPSALGEQWVQLIGGSRANPTRLRFEKQGEALVSDTALPAGQSVPVILRIRMQPSGKAITERFNVDLSDCPDCDYKEYACTCAH